MSYIFHLLLQSVAIYLVARFLPGVHLRNFLTAIWVALVYSLCNFFLGSLLYALALPFAVFTIGLSLLLVNALLLWITDKLIEDFEIDDFFTTLLAAALISAVNWLLGLVF